MRALAAHAADVLADGDRARGRHRSLSIAARRRGSRDACPATIVALLAGTVAVAALGLPVETIGTRFGGIPSGLPAFHVPDASVPT